MNNDLTILDKIELYPKPIEKDNVPQETIDIPFERLGMLGAQFKPMIQSLNSAGGSGLYKVSVPKGMKLSYSQKKGGFIGGAMGKAPREIGQSTLTPVMFDPISLSMAITMASIDKKMDEIKEIQQDIMDFITQKEKSELRGDLIFLRDISDGYRYNWNNEKYLVNNHIKVLDIKQSMEEKINFYQEQISSNISKRSFFHGDGEVKKKIGIIKKLLEEYQLSLYTFAHSSLMEIMLLGNYDGSYLNSIVKKILSYKDKFEQIYNDCREEIDNYVDTSVKSKLIEGLSKISGGLGNKIAQQPHLSKSQLDENLIENGKRLEEYRDNRKVKSMSKFTDGNIDFINMFIDNISVLNKVHNEGVNLYLDNDTLQIELN